MIEKLIAFFRKPKEETQGRAPEGLCPNCWGEQEYDNMVRELYKDKQIDVNNHGENHAFIQDFVVTHLNGITLKKGISGTGMSDLCNEIKIEYPNSAIMKQLLLAILVLFIYGNTFSQGGDLLFKGAKKNLSIYKADSTNTTKLKEARKTDRYDS